jgi:flavin reductase (DIM6/NTAB) family NADH-FMN oxidoreductase RutF
MISKTGLFNLSILTESVPFSVFKQFGFQCGKDVDKFAGVDYVSRTPDGIRYIPVYANCVISARVVESLDCGTHTLFVAAVTRSVVLSDEASVTYQFYFDNIKPRPVASQGKMSGYVCKICNYVYDGEPLPGDFVCPVCKHGADDFVRRGR